MRALLRDYMPWLLPEYAPLRELTELELKPEVHTLSIDDATGLRRFWRRALPAPGILCKGSVAGWPG